MDPACACASARLAARLLTRLYDARLRGTGLEAPQFGILMTLEQQGVASQAELGRRYALDKTTVSRNLKLLARRGWIEETAAEDRRKHQFGLTGAGRKLVAAAKPEWKKAQNDLRSAMGAGEWDAMFRTFRSIAKSLQHPG